MYVAFVAEIHLAMKHALVVIFLVVVVQLASKIMNITHSVNRFIDIVNVASIVKHCEL